MIENTTGSARYRSRNITAVAIVYWDDSTKTIYLVSHAVKVIRDLRNIYLLHFLGNDVMRKITDGSKKTGPREYSVVALVGWVLRLPGCLFWYSWSSLLWLMSWVLDKAFRLFYY